MTLLREEKRIALRIASLAFAVVATGVEFFPHAGVENMFVSLVPAPIDHFCEIRIRGSALQTTFSFPFLERSWGVVKEWDIGGTESFVDNEVVELVMLLLY